MEGKFVVVIDVPFEFDGVLTEFVRLDGPEGLLVLRLFATILEARRDEESGQ